MQNVSNVPVGTLEHSQFAFSAGFVAKNRDAPSVPVGTLSDLVKRTSMFRLEHWRRQCSGWNISLIMFRLEHWVWFSAKRASFWSRSYYLYHFACLGLDNNERLS